MSRSNYTNLYSNRCLVTNQVDIVHTITIDDTTAPVVSGSITASDVEGVIGDAPAAETTVAGLEGLTGDLAIEDACTADTNLVVTSSDASDGNTCPEVITRTYTVTDACSNASVDIVHTITIDDTTAPVVSGSITASDVEGCDASAAPAAETTVAGLEGLTGDLAIEDACTADTNLVVTSSDASDGNTCPEVITRTYTVTDACSNASVDIVHTITIDDTTAPVVSGSITASDVEGCDASAAPAAETTVAGLEGLTGDLAIEDACTADTNLVVTSSDASDGNTCPEVITRTYTVTDACSNASVDIVHTITIDDTTAPVVSGSITASDVEGCDASAAPAAETTVAGLEGLTGDLAIEDACTADTNLVVTSSDASDGNTCPEVITRTYTVTDACSNASVDIVHTITIDDTTAPVVSGSITASDVEGCDAPAAETTVAGLEGLTGDLAIEDACTADTNLVVTSSDASDGNTCPEVITRTYTVTDACSNASVDIVHTITIDDTTAPVVSGSITASDVEGCDAPAAETTVAGLEGLTGDLAIEDACTADTNLVVTSSDASDGNTCPEVITRTYTVTDACSNASVDIVHTITIDDTTAPVVSGSITASDVEGCDASAAPAAETTVAGLEGLTGDLAIEDACTADTNLVVTSSDASDGNTCPEVITRTYTVTDACSNASVDIVHTITIDDTTAPVVSGSITASDVEGCDASAAPAAETTVAGLEGLTGDLAIEDACTADTNLVVTSSDASDGNTCPEVITRTYTVTDACSNASVDIVHTITIDDTTAPVVSGSITASDVEGCDASAAPAAETTVAGLEGLTGDLAIEDACTADTNLVVTSSDASDGNTCPEVITRTYTVTDACSNASVDIVHTITIDDTTAPVVSGSITASDVEGCDASAAPAAETTVAGLEGLTGDLAIEDACTADTNLVVTSSDASDGNTCPEVITRTYTVTDACSNASVDIVHTITIDDTTAPVVSGSITASDVEGCDASAAPAAETTVAGLEGLTGDLAIEDACTADTNLVVTSSDASDGNTCPEVITRTYTVTDACSNASVDIVHTITIDDTTAPVVSGSITASDVEGCDASAAPAAETTVAGLEGLTGDLAIEDACTADTNLVVTSSDASDGNTCPEVITRTYTVTDACSNASVDIVHTITIDDTTAPVVSGSITASDVEGCDASAAPAAETTVAGLEGLTGDLAIEDACTADTNLVVTSSDASDGNTCPEVITRTYTVTDACSNASVDIVHTITIDDTTAPVVSGSITASDVEGCDASAAPAAETTVAGLEGLTGDLAIEDACTADTNLVVTSSDASDGNTCPEVITRTYTVTDACSNASVDIVHTITIDDTTAPVVSGSITASDVEGCDASAAPAAETTVAGLEGLTGDLAIEDACTADTNLVVTSSDASDGNTCPEVITRTYTVTDACSNASVDIVHTITIDDTTAPVVSGSITASDVEGCDASAAPAAETTVAGLEGLTGDLAIEDACTADTNLVVTSSDASDGNTCPEVITRTYTVTDACSNASVDIVHTITIDDTTAPVVSGSITASDVEGCDASAAPAAETTVAGLEGLTGDLAIEDACTADTNLVVTSSDASDGNTCPEVITRTYTVTDACSNASVDIVHTITIDDTTAPVVSGSITASDVEGCDASAAPAAETTVAGLEGLTGDLAIEDACTADTNLVVTSSDASDGNTCPEVITRTYTVTDACSNASVDIVHTITIDDTTAPTLTVAATNSTAECDGTSDPGDAFATWLANNGGATATDACGSVTWSHNSTGLSDTCGATGTEEVTFTATDACANTTTTTATFTIVDTTAPVITCPVNISVPNDAGNCSAVVTFAAATATDSCGSATVTQTEGLASGSAFPVGVSTIEFTAEDECGLTTTCEFTITVIDNEDPTITCAADQTATTDAGNCTAAVTVVAPTTADNCGVASVTNNFNGTADASGTYPIGTTTVVWTVTDNSGNIATCSMDITVTDNEAPNAVCQDITASVDASGNLTITGDDVDGGSTDNCTGMTLSVSPNTFDCTDTGTTVTVTLTATDAAGLTDTCTANVTIIDQVAPTAVCQDITVQLDATGNVTITAADVDNGSSDGCGGAVTLALTPSSSFDCDDLGANTVTLFVTDASGNVSFCTATVTVEDSVAPTITCAADQTQSADSGLCTAAVTVVGPTISDNCSIASITNDFNSTADASDDYPVGTTTVTWTLTDGSGNTCYLYSRYCSDR